MFSVYEVGGCVRDELLGVPTKDYDYAVDLSEHRLSDGHTIHTIPAAFVLMRRYLQNAGFEIFVESPEYATIRARFPRGDRPKSLKPITADFVLCRKDGPSSDGRRPDYVEVGTLADDLARRDFTVNALARPVDIYTGARGSAIIDYHDGLNDLNLRRLRFVGDPMERLREDGLRALRAIRFKITKGFEFHDSTREALRDPETPSLLAGTSVERRREELERCFHHDTLATLEMLANDLPLGLKEAIFSGSLRLSATQKRDFVHAQTGGEKDG